MGRDLTRDLSLPSYRFAHIVERVADLSDACWEGYEEVGMKMLDGKQVPNCVPFKTRS